MKALLSLLFLLSINVHANDDDAFAQTWIVNNMEDTTLLLGFTTAYNLVGSLGPSEYGAVLMLGSPLAMAHSIELTENIYTSVSLGVLLLGFGYYNTQMEEKDLSYEKMFENNMLASAILYSTLLAIDNLTEPYLPEEVSVEPIIQQNTLSLNLKYNF